MSDQIPEDHGEAKYPQVMRAVTETPWAVLPATLAAIVELLSLRASGYELTDEQIQARIGSGPPRRDFYMAGTVAVIPIYGVLIPRADMFTQMSGGTSVQRLQASFQDALDDKDVTAIVLDIDSPGGAAALIPEFAAVIRAARGEKPIVAVANHMAASAAYWLGAQAGEFVLTPSGEVGSVGVLAAHDDISAMQEKLGVKTTLVSAGKFKTEMNPFEPLSDEARAEIQRRVDEVYTVFLADVAKGRRVSVDTVRTDFGQGRMVTAQAALAAGMVDRVETFDAAIARLSRPEMQQGAAAQTYVATVTSKGTVGAWFPGTIGPPGQTASTMNIEAAESGLSFADSVEQALRAFDQVVSGAEELRSLTGAKRAQLDGLIERAQDLAALLDKESEPAALGLDAEHDWLLTTHRI
jgi:signal peptide peptidase SppA